jgi:hypothetical protein
MCTSGDKIAWLKNRDRERDKQRHRSRTKRDCILLSRLFSTWLRRADCFVSHDGSLLHEIERFSNREFYEDLATVIFIDLAYSWREVRMRFWTSPRNPRIIIVVRRARGLIQRFSLLVERFCSASNCIPATRVPPNDPIQPSYEAPCIASDSWSLI